MGEVGSEERRRRIRNRLLTRTAPHARQDERERPPEGGSERAVRRRPVSHHHALIAIAAPYELDHRQFRLARDFGRVTGCGRNRGGQCARAGQQAARNGERRIEIRRDEACTAACRVGRGRQALDVHGLERWRMHGD